ncbi:MAG: GtrA family protein [Burkholderiaceae bacterium]|nr:GtrA family protein [Microbacteriaceae bacterium]
MRRFIHQLGRFGLVGLVGVVIDFSVFNLLRSTVLAPELVSHGPLAAKAISVSVAIVANWLGNRYWTFRAERRPHLLREAFEFAVVSVGGMAIALGCLWVSHYALGFTSTFADNISANVVGLALGTAFRFWLYRTWVFPDSASNAGAATSAAQVDADERAQVTEPARPRTASIPLVRVATGSIAIVSARPTRLSRPEHLTARPGGARRSD